VQSIKHRAPSIRKGSPTSLTLATLAPLLPPHHITFAHYALVNTVLVRAKFALKVHFPFPAASSKGRMAFLFYRSLPFNAELPVLIHLDWPAKKAQQRYRRRFDIESSYRQLGPYLVMQRCDIVLPVARRGLSRMTSNAARC
jgi:hypothetical protein